MTPAVIRTATLADVEAILTFWVTSAEGTDRRDDPAKVVALIERDPEALLVYELDGAVAGTVIAGWDGWRAHLYRLAVAPEHRRKGVARQLIAAAEERFKAFGAFRVDAMVLHDNTDAHPAWAATGYVMQEQWGRWVKHF
ncbi:GNAT family N-acetyltransferase [Herbidospora sp. NEAU-GS84]|uniref:GNAT family N-acetyltransferase n=1 Tax=Herbidospora solisilvae TaxID=2696284 RepID=A0A7C9NSF3_9ACTN|nr:GNAT family N-acetyltransferase [Herbidospora solisilvae]NAS26456.1 GNAT family N-acetyltransferase [Herbidospora solisilvae]